MVVGAPPQPRIRRFAIRADGARLAGGPLNNHLAGTSKIALFFFLTQGSSGPSVSPPREAQGARFLGVEMRILS